MSANNVTRDYLLVHKFLKHNLSRYQEEFDKRIDDEMILLKQRLDEMENIFSYEKSTDEISSLKGEFKAQRFHVSWNISKLVEELSNISKYITKPPRVEIYDMENMKTLVEKCDYYDQHMDDIIQDFTIKCQDIKRRIIECRNQLKQFETEHCAKVSKIQTYMSQYNTIGTPFCDEMREKRSRFDHLKHLKERSRKYYKEILKIFQVDNPDMYMLCQKVYMAVKRGDTYKPVSSINICDECRKNLPLDRFMNPKLHSHLKPIYYRDQFDGVKYTCSLTKKFISSYETPRIIVQTFNRKKAKVEKKRLEIQHQHDLARLRGECC